MLYKEDAIIIHIETFELASLFQWFSFCNTIFYTFQLFKLCISHLMNNNHTPELLSTEGIPNKYLSSRYIPHVFIQPVTSVEHLVRSQYLGILRGAPSGIERLNGKRYQIYGGVCHVHNHFQKVAPATATSKVIFFFFHMTLSSSCHNWLD